MLLFVIGSAPQPLEIKMVTTLKLNKLMITAGADEFNYGFAQEDFEESLDAGVFIPAGSVVFVNGPFININVRPGF